MSYNVEPATWPWDSSSSLARKAEAAHRRARRRALIDDLMQRLGWAAGSPSR